MSLVSLDQAKSHLRITDDTDDDYLTDLIDDAEQYVFDDLNLDANADPPETLDAQPLPVRRAVLLLISHWYETREPVTSGAAASQPQPVPLAYESVIWKYRRTTFC